MAITCALGTKHIEALTRVISKAMLDSVEKKEEFDINSFMNRLYTNLKDKQGLDNAIQYMQQVPYIANRIDAKLEIDLSKDTSGNEISLKALSKSFRNEDNGIQLVFDYFEKTLTPEQLSIIATDNANRPVEKYINTEEEDDKELPVTNYNDKRLKTRNILSGTHEEFIAQTPDATVENVDENKIHAINTIGRISILSKDIDMLDNIKLDGVELKLKPIRLTKIAVSDRTKYSKDLIEKQNAINAQGTSVGNVTPVSEQLALVITDSKGAFVYFSKDGKVTTKENGGKIVYQMLRDVRENNGRYKATDIYGIEDQIMSPAVAAASDLKDSGLTKSEFEKSIGMSFNDYISSIDEQQQKQLKQTYDFKNNVLKGDKTPLLSLVGASKGVFNFNISKSITLKNISTYFPTIKDDILKSIVNLEEKYKDFESGRTIVEINGQEFELDRSHITPELAKKIAEVLTNPKIKNKEKKIFYNQFYSDKKISLPSSTQRHDLNWDGTNLVFTYVPNTLTESKTSDFLKKQNAEPKPISLTDPKSAEEIEKILLSGWSTKAGVKARSKISYNTDLIKKNQLFFDYENGQFVEKNYLDFLLEQDGRIKVGPNKTIPLFNSYLKFSFDNATIDQVNTAKETVNEKEDDRSEIRKFKDNLVAELKSDFNLKFSATVVKVNETTVKDAKNKTSYSTYTITVKIDGKEGEHKFYQSKLSAKVGDVFSVGLIPIEIKDGYGYPDNVSLFKVENGTMKYFGSLAETDYSKNESKRDIVPMLQDLVADQEEVEDLAEVTVAPKTVTEEESDVQVAERTNPSNTSNPADSSPITNLFKKFKLDRKTSLPQGVTAEQVDNALEWWSNSPLNKYIGLEQVSNIVNSDAYARFIVSGSTLVAGQYTGRLGTIQINKATGGSLVDTYHEAWHGFSQLFLTRKEKIDLYNELKKSNPKYANLSFLELEEILAEDFRSYALNQKTKPSSPKRNSLFRRILNFLQKLFGGETSISDNLQQYNVESQGVAGELFRNLYLASSNPGLLNIYTPSMDNVMFDILNRGITQNADENEPALNPKDSDLVNQSIDSSLSDIVDENFKLNEEIDPTTVNKAGTTKIVTDPNNREVAYEIVKEKFKERLVVLREKLKITPEKPFASFNTLKNLEDNASAIIKSENGDNKYIFLKSQIEDYNNLSLATKKGRRIKGELYKNSIEIIGDFYTHDSIKDSTKGNATIIVVDTIEEAKAQYDNYKEGGAISFTGFKINPLVNAQSTYEISNNQANILNSIRILQTAVNNWESVIKYHEKNSDYEIVKKEIEVALTKDDTDAASDVKKSEKVKSEIGKESLFELSGKDVIYILKSLHKKIKVAGSNVNEFNELGFKKTANFRQMWNTLVKVTDSAKDPQVMYNRIVEATANFPELEQLVKFKLPNPENSNNTYEFDITTSFWSVFSLPRVPYLQLSIFATDEGLSTEVTSGSLDTNSVVKKFQSNFQSNKNNPYINKDKSNVAYLNLNKIVTDFSKNGVFNDSKAIEFLNAIGIELEKTKSIEEEINKLTNRTFFGLPYIFDTINDLNILNQKQNKTKEETDLLFKFRINPVKALVEGIPANMIGAQGSRSYKEGSKQKTQIERIAELQIKYGYGVTSMSASNAEGNKVNEHTTDNTLTFIADALNNVSTKTQMYENGNPLRFLNPKNNPWANSSITLKMLFGPSNIRNTNKSIGIFQMSGTQRTDTDVNDGQNTTNLSAQGKLLQDIHTFLKSGKQEIMRTGSKSSAWAWAIQGGIQTGLGKSNEPYLYADIDSFIPQSGGEREVIEDLILPYLDSELKRINIYKTNPEAKNYVGYNRKANQEGETFGEIFNVFNGVLKNDTQNKLRELIKDPNVSLVDYLNENTDLKNEIIKEISTYFNNKSAELYDQVEKASFFDYKLINKLSQYDAPTTEKQKVLLKAYFYNTWIHNVETSILFFTGDIAQLDHSKENGHKRTSGLISNGPRIRTDIAAQRFLSNTAEGGFNNSTYARTLPEGYDNFRYDGYVNTAIIEDISRDSIYMPEIRRRLTQDIKKRNPKMPDSKISEIVERRVGKYSKSEIKEGDGQGYISFDVYRTFKKAQKNWSTEQERLYQKVVRGEITDEEIIKEGFPPYKLQNFGFVEDTVLPVGAMHKFALMPLIPSAIKGTELEVLHKLMLKQNIHYVTFASGSKTGGVTSDGNPDQIFEPGSKKIKPGATFTNNRIHVGYLKDVTNVPSKLKGQVIFSTQLRKEIIEGLLENGIGTSKKAQKLFDDYSALVNFYTDVLRKDLENEIGYKKDANGVYIGKPDKFLKLIQRNLKQKDYPDHIIDSLKVNKDGTLKYDLSYFIDTEGIENIIMSIINKKLVKQKVNGEALVQVASSMWNGTWDTTQGNKFKNLTGDQLEEARRKYLGTNNLPFYTEGPDGNTLPMKVAISLQGDFFNLLNLLHIDGERIGNVDRLNDMIKNDEWLNKDNNRKSITLTAVRIPVQGLNSMEFMEVYHFLPSSAQNIIIPPTEIVAKSGGDYDVDKLTTFFPNINSDGSFSESSISNEKFFEEINRIEANGKNPADVIKTQKKAVENQMLQSIKSILEIEENYATLVTPNDTDLLKPIADNLQKYVSPRDKYSKANGEEPNLSFKGKKMISQTSMFEPLYNNEKFGANMGGKGVLGIFANDNALNPLLTSVGYKMPKKYKPSKFIEKLKRYVESGVAKYDMRLFLPHQEIDGHISLSNINTVGGTKISEIYSQAVNGSVDVEADEWIFYIQGNLEISSILSYLIKTGVTEEYAIFFVSNPLIREYAERQRLAKGVFGGPTGTASTNPEKTQYDSANFVYDKYISLFINNQLANTPSGEKLKVQTTESTPMGLKTETNEYTKQELLDILPNIKNIIDFVKNKDEELIYQKFNPSNAKAYDTSTFLSGMPGVLKDGNFDKIDLLDIITTNKEFFTPEQLNIALAGFAHFIEMEKQTKGLTALKRQIKPDVNTLRTLQEATIQNLNTDLLFDSSKVDLETAYKLIKDSLVSSFGNTDMIEKIFMPMMSLINSNGVSNFIANSVGGYSKSEKNKIDKIVKIYGPGYDGVIKFIKAYKTGLKTFILQNYLSNMIDRNGTIISIPKTYNKLPVKINNSLATDVAIIDGQFIVNEKRIRKDFNEKNYIEAENVPNNYSSREGLEAFSQSTDLFATEESYFKYVLEREYLFARGLRGDELNQMALINVFNPDAILLDNKYSYTNLLLSVINENRKSLSRNYSIIDQIRKAVEISNFNVLTLSDKATLTGSDQSRYANELKALANPRIQKVDDPEENTKLSRLFELLPIMTIYQHGPGKTLYGFDLALPVDNYLSEMTIAGDLFKNNYNNSKSFNLIFKKLTASKSRIKNLVVTGEEYNQYAPENTVYEDSEEFDSDEIGTRQSPTIEPTQPTGTSLSGDRPVFDSLPSKSTTPTMTYAGIGSRETPQEVLDTMTKVATYLESLGYTLNTGKTFKARPSTDSRYQKQYEERLAFSKKYDGKVGLDEEGADRAFSLGATKKNLFGVDTPIGTKEMQVMEEIHPNPNALKEGAKKLMARNTNQVFGANLDTPVDFVLFYAKEVTGSIRPQGGTGQAVEMARRKGIPTINMADTNWRAQLKTAIATQSSTSVGGFQGYKGDFENTGKGTPEGDGKDKAMRQIADGFIGETLDYGKPSSTMSSANEINEKINKLLGKDKKQDIRLGNLNEDTNSNNYKESVPIAGTALLETSRNIIIMLARNGGLRNRPLGRITKSEILKQYNKNAEFVVGDMPNVDSQFIDYLQEIGATFTIYHTGTTPRIQVKATTQSSTSVNPFKTSQIQQKVYHVDKRKGLTEETLVDDGTMVFSSGVFFTTEKEYAENYAKAIGGEIYEAYVDVQKPLIVSDKQTIERLGRKPDEIPTGNDSVTHNSNNVKADKYGKVGTEIVVYKPQQIRLILTTTQSSTSVKVISEDYGVVQAETNPSNIEKKADIDLIKEHISKQTFKENVGQYANEMFHYSLRWGRKSYNFFVLKDGKYIKSTLNDEGSQLYGKDKYGVFIKSNRTDKAAYNNGLLNPLDIDSFAGKGDGYGYDLVDQNGNPLPSIKDLQPIIDKIEAAIGINMKDYDSVIGNFYLPGEYVYPHKDTSESKSARNYPVIVYSIGNDAGLGIVDNNEGKMTFANQYDERFLPANDKLKGYTNEILTKHGSIYTFGMDGKGRFELTHSTPTNSKKDKPQIPITLPSGKVVTNYTITLTFRRAADLEPGMPTTPAKLSTQPTESSKTVKAYRTSDTFSSKVNYAQRGSGLYYALDKPFQELGANDKVEEVNISYNPSKTLDATTEEGQTKFMNIKRLAIEGKSFKSMQESNDAVAEAMRSNGYDSLIGWIDQDVKDAGRELVLYTQPTEATQAPVQPGQSENQLLNKVGDIITQTSKLRYKTVNLPGTIRKIEKTENGYNVTLNIKGYDGGTVINVIIENGKVIKSIQRNPLKVGEFLENTTSTYDFNFSEPISSQPTQQTIMPNATGEIADGYEFKFDDNFSITTPFKLNDQQKAALLGLVDFYNNPEKYNNEIALIGYAGTGKTTIMALFDKYLKHRGRMPKYSAPTHRANAVTRMNNPKANVITLHKAFGLSPMIDLTSGQISVENLESEQNGQVKLDYGDYLIIDEFSMITDQLYKFIENYRKKQNIKIIYMGDPAQLSPVDPKKKETVVSQALSRPQKLELTKVERTSDNPILDESTNLRQGKPLSMISNDVNGKGVEYMSSTSRINQVIGQSLDEMKETNDFLHFRMLSAKNSGLKLLNDLARKNLFNADDSIQIVENEILMGYDNYGDDPENYDIYNSGDYRVIGQPVETKKVLDTMGAKMGKIEFSGYNIMLENLLDKDAEPVNVFVVKNKVNKEASKKLIVAISTLAQSAKSAPTRQIRGMLFSQMYTLKSSVTFMEDQYNDFGKIAIKKTLDYGYAHTIHKSQGGTYNKVLVLLDSIDNSKFEPVVKQQLKYVAVSRARDYVYVVTNSGISSQTKEDMRAIDPATGDPVVSSFTFEGTEKTKPTVASKAAGELPMADSDVIKIVNGTKLITNKTAIYSDGVYTVGGIQQIQLKYEGKAAVFGNNIIITNENKNRTYTRSKDDFAKAEGFKNWSDFQANNKYAEKFISGKASRYIYSVKPLGEIKEQFGAAQKLDPQNNPAIAAFNQKLIDDKGVLPKEFIYNNGSFTSKYALNSNNLYNLVDIDTGSIYLRNINLQTGDIITIDEPIVPVDKKRVTGIINSLRSQIKEFRLDEILAEKGIDINEELDKLENVNTESELNEIMIKINKNMC